MSEENKYISIQDFKEQGYLQEVNRRFLHPLGLAFSIKIDDDGNHSFGGILDMRDDKEGIYFDLQNSDEDRKQRAISNKNAIEEQIKDRHITRIENLGFFIEPVE